MSEPGGKPRTPARTLRRVVVAIAVLAFSIAALGGIIALLGAEIGETAWRILGTTAVIGAFSIGVLCCAALVGRRLQAFGVVGSIVSIIACGLVVFIIWYRGPYGDWWDSLLRLTFTGIAFATAFALASLLLLLADRRRPAVRIGLLVTLALFAVVLCLVVYGIWWSNTLDNQVYPRLLGVTSILAALGAVIVPVISLLLRDRSEGSELSPDAVTRLEQEASRRGMSPDALVAQLLAANLDSAPPALAQDPAGPALAAGDSEQSHP